VECIKLAKACGMAPETARGTCKHAYGNIEIAYFIVADAVEAQVAGILGLTIKLKVVERKVRVLEKPKPLPNMQIDCAPAPSRREQVGRFSSQVVANQEWTKCMLKLEKEAFAIMALMQGVCQRLHATTEQWDKRLREVTEQEKLFRIREQRAKHPTTQEQGVWQARCKLLAKGRWRSSADKDKLQELYSEATTKSNECDQQLLKERHAKRADTMDNSADPLEAAEFTLSEWKALWRTSDPMQQQVTPWEVEAREQLDDFTEEDVAKLKGLARCVRRGVHDAEKTLAWPVHMGTVLFFMIPKTFTTDRVIGLLPTTIRPWDCTSFGKAAEDAAWDVLLSHEMDNPDVEDEYTEATITAILGLVKAFERVSHFVLWEAGKQLKFNTGVLAVVFSYFAMARRLIVGESVSEETRTVATIIAGSKLSVRFLKMVIQSTVDGLVVERPIAKWRMYVALGACFEGFDKLGLNFSIGSAGKGAVMASAKWLRKVVAKDIQQR
ncbi:unnamed protein product, partial [Prorocentrum cordatum]